MSVLLPGTCQPAVEVKDCYCAMDGTRADQLTMALEGEALAVLDYLLGEHRMQNTEQLTAAL